MSKGLVRVKMSGDRQAELYKLYDGLWGCYEPDNAHELLLYGHISELRDILERMADREQAKYTLTFTALQALAFVQLWEPKPYALTPLRALIIQSIFNELDKKVNRGRFQNLQIRDNHFS